MKAIERERGRRTLSTEHSGGWRTAETSGGFAVSGPGGGTGGGGHGVAEYVPTPGERVRLPRTIGPDSSRRRKRSAGVELKI